MSYITAVSPITCEYGSLFETLSLESILVLSETSMIRFPPYIY